MELYSGSTANRMEHSMYNIKLKPIIEMTLLVGTGVENFCPRKNIHD